MSGDTQQAVRLVMQSRAVSFSPMSSRVTQLLFWYVVPLSDNQTSPAPGKLEKSTEYTLSNSIPEVATTV